MLVLILVGIMVYGTVMAVDTLVLTGVFGADNMHNDIARFQARTATILRGGLLYKDVHTETPPLIDYLMVPAQLLGGADHYWVYSAYFCFFGIVDALVLYLVLRRFDDYLAFMVGLMFILSPFGFIEAGTGQDETIVAFTIIVPALLMLLKRDRSAPVAAALGIWTKMWSILLVPVQFLRARTWKEKLYIVLVAAAISAIVALPFLYLCGDDFTWFLRFYFIGDGARKSEGFSVLHFMDVGGIGLPKQVELAMVLIGLAVAYLYAYKKKMGVWESITLAVVVFFAFYPKMCTGYYLIPITLLLIWGADDRKIAARCFLVYIPVILAVGFAPMYSGKAYFDVPGSWIIGLFLSLTANIMLIETAYTAFKRKPFIYRSADEPARNEQ